jgi:mannose-6-phosphate isomerase
MIAIPSENEYACTMCHPITFTPLYMERVWGGRELERVYQRALPTPDHPYGEAWEIVDRDDEQSVVTQGPLAGTSLHDLWTHHRTAIFGPGYESFSDRFPILFKILDARDDLSIQVHPPVDKAGLLGGEPKTEMWFIADCDPGAKLYVGFRHGVTCDDFRRALDDGSVAESVHAISPAPGESIFIPSGRLHAIGAGFLIHEIQQNSDTTYRVFDWNRLGLDGKPRDLHVEKSMASIDFDDFEPAMDTPHGNTLATCPYFRTDHIAIAEGQAFVPENTCRFVILSVIEGSLTSTDGRTFSKGDTLLLPAKAEALQAHQKTSVLAITLP